MKLRILEHYHGDLSGKRHLQAGEEYEVPGEVVLTAEAAEALVERGKAVLVAGVESGAGETDTTDQVEAPADEPSAEFPQMEWPGEAIEETATEPTKAAIASEALVATMASPGHSVPKRRQKK